MKPIIGIVGRPGIDECDASVISIMDNYRQAVIKAGGIPILILPPQTVDYWYTKNQEIKNLTEEEKDILKRVIDMCDGILIGGGERILAYQRYIYEYTTKIDKPLLGICLGMQLFANYQDPNNVSKNETLINHRDLEAKYKHKITINKNSLLYKIINKEEISVNSFHNYHVDKIRGYNVVAISEDGLIEGIEHPSKKFNIGVQWHPEVMMKYDENNLKLMKYFISCCKNFIVFNNNM